MTNNIAARDDWSFRFAADLIESALRDSSPNFAEVLRRIVEEFNAFGCIVWEYVPSDDSGKPNNPKTDPELLITLAAWFPDGKRLPIDDLPTVGTVSGNALMSGVPKKVDDVKIDGGPRCDEQFHKDNNIGPLCSWPIQFHDGRHGTFDLLRQVDQGPFTNDEVERVKPVAAQVPQLYRAVRDRLSLQLIQTINDAVRQALDTSQFESADGFSKCLKWICEQVGQTLNSLEVSIVLKNTKPRNHFTVRATTWKEGELEEEHQNYQVDTEVPLESWKTNRKTVSVIRHSEPILLFDIQRAIPNSVAKKHPGLSLDPHDSFIGHAKGRLGLTTAPISYIAVPVHFRGTTIGAIRCCGALSPPHYFSQRDLDLLQVIAGQVAHLAGTRAHLREADEQLKAVERFASGLSSLNSTIQNEIAQSHPNIDTVMNEAIRQIQQMVPAYAIDFRRYNEKERSLQFDKFGGDFWDNASPELYEEIRKMLFQIDTAAAPEKAKSAGDFALITSNAYWAEDINKDRFFTKHGLFKGAKQALVVPVKAGTRSFGVLDLVFAADATGLSHNWRKLVEVMGTQLGLYNSLIDKLGQLNQLRIDVDRSYEELAHNLKGPLAQARDRADRMVALVDRGRQVPIGNLRAVRGLCRKALGVMRILAMSTEFHSGSAVKLHMADLSVERLIGLLNQAANDYELNYQSSNVNFYVDSRSVQTAFMNRHKRTDFDLLEQAIFNVFDNAIKYSYAGSKIEVKGLRLSASEVGIEVANQGIFLSANDAARCRERGWRGVDAQKVTQDGSGLGLWLVDNILNAISGRLEVRATDNKGWTRAQIILK